MRRSHLVHAELFCQSSCVLPRHQSYVWYKNGQKVAYETSALYPDFFDHADSVSCALSPFEDFPAPTVCKLILLFKVHKVPLIISFFSVVIWEPTRREKNLHHPGCSSDFAYVCVCYFSLGVIDETCNRVSYSTRTICAFTGSSVNISANYSTSEDHFESKTWSCTGCPVQWPSPSAPGGPGKGSDYAGRVQVVEPERGLSTLTIKDLRDIDSAEYRFTFTTRGFEWRSDLPGTTLTVSGGGKMQANFTFALTVITHSIFWKKKLPFGDLSLVSLCTLIHIFTEVPKLSIPTVNDKCIVLCRFAGAGEQSGHAAVKHRG